MIAKTLAEYIEAVPCVPDCATCTELYIEELQAEISRLDQQFAQTAEQLTRVQEECTRLLLENRGLKYRIDICREDLTY